MSRNETAALSRNSTTRDLALTFAGGGNRAFYQMGLISRWQDWLLPRVAVVASCSAGACVVTTLLSGRREEAREFWLRQTSNVKRNFDLTKLARGERPAPHGDIYRDTLLVTFRHGGLERIKAQPFPVLILASVIPRILPVMLSVAVGIGLYSLERNLKRGPHPKSPRILGSTPLVVDARDCDSPEELTALVLASSSTPPFTPVGDFRGTPLLDGGMIDNAPASIAEEHPDVKRSVVLLTRPYHPSVLGERRGRFYLAPTQPPPIGRWDYTQPHLLDDTIAMGEREADVHRPTLEAYLR